MTVRIPRHWRKTARRLSAALTVLVLAVASAPASAVLEIDITAGNVDPLPVAITDFDDSGLPSGGIGSDIAGVVSADLERSGLFRPIDPAAFIDPDSTSARPRFGDWRQINAQALVTGRVTEEPDGRIRAEFRLWDTFAEQQMTGLVYVTTSANWRRVSHLISDAIYKRLTGEDGYFDTRIVYISETGPADRRIKRLAIMDQDGENHRFLTDGRDLVLTPRFSPKRQEITYLSYFDNTPRVFIYNIDTGQQEVLGDFEGMTFAPRFSPDGNKVVMSLALEGNSDVYSMDVLTRRVQRLTQPSLRSTPRRRILRMVGALRSIPTAAAPSNSMSWMPTATVPKRISFGGGPLCHPGVVAARRSDRLHEISPRPLLHRCHAA